MKKSAKDNPNNVEVQLLLGKIALAKGDTATAETSWRQAEKISPGNIEAADGLVEIATSRNDAATLVEIAEKIIASHPNYPNAYIWRGMAEASRKEFDKAEADYQTVIKNAPNYSAAYLQLALVRIAQGRAADAKALLQTALDKDPNSARALDLLVAYDMQAKQPAKALARVQTQIAKEPGNGMFDVELARLQMNSKDFKDALDSSQKAMQLAPQSSEAVQTYTQAEVAMGNIDTAIGVWDKWLVSHPNDIQATNLLGSLEEAKGDQSKAMQDYKKTLQVDSTNAVASNNLAYLMVQNGENVDVALTMAQTARRGLPDSPQTADTLAWIYYYKGNYEASRDLLESALKENPDNASMHLHLGMAYAKLNRTTDAVPQLKKAESLDPNGKVGQDAKTELAKLS